MLPKILRMSLPEFRHVGEIDRRIVELSEISVDVPLRSKVSITTGLSGDDFNSTI